MRPELKVILITAIIVIGVALLGWGSFSAVRRLAYARVERLTELHADEFTAVAHKVGAGTSTLVYFKVFRCTPDEAQLFAVYEGKHSHRDGVYVYMERQSGEWQVVGYELVWASHGSADGRTWPPYW
jgi:hypothetical protein